ncbi:MAG: hypothetical protein ABEJ99_02295 [Candidatus Nanohaloarchaea archaeon]
MAQNEFQDFSDEAVDSVDISSDYWTIDELMRNADNALRDRDILDPETTAVGIRP